MPTLTGMSLPPLKDWQDFQRLCRDLWRHILDDPNTQENGRQGQPQAGVDVYGRSKSTGGMTGVQCKEKDRLAGSVVTIDELKGEVVKAKTFRPVLTEFTLATTGPRDGKLQQEARKITERHLKKGLFSVHVWSWEEIEIELSNYPHLLQKHWPDLFGSTVATKLIAKEVSSQISEEVRDKGIGLKQELGSLLVQGLSEIKQEIRVSVGSELEAELAYVKRLIEENKPKTCLIFLDELIQKYGDKVSSKTKFRLLTNKASCYLAQEKIDDAGILFVQALQFNQDDEKAFVNAALGYYMLKEPEKAEPCIEQALEKNPLNLDAWTLKIQFVQDIDSLNRVWESLPKSLVDKPQINWVRGVALQRMGKLAEAEKSMSYALDNDNERRLNLVVEMASVMLQNVLNEAKPVRGRKLTPEFKARLVKVESLFTEALTRLAESDILPIKIIAATNRGTANRFLGRVDRAKRDLEQALEWGPEDFQAAKQRAIISLDEEKYEEAIDLLKPLAERLNNLEAKMLLADSYRLHGKYLDAVQLLKDCETWTVTLETKSHALLLLTDSYFRLKQKASALSCIEVMKKLEPLSFVPFVHQARIERLSGEHDIAKGLVLTAKTMIGAEVDFFDEWSLADELYALELYEEAAAVYARIANPELDDVLTRGLIESLMNADQREKALEYCSRLRRIHPEVQYATEYAAAIYDAIGDLAQAIGVLQEYLTLRPNDNHARLRLSKVFWKNGNIEQVILELAKITNEENLHPNDVFHYASLLSATGDVEKAIKILYEARRRKSDDPEIEMSYIATIMWRGDDLPILKEPHVVSADCVVFLEGDDHEKYFYIIEDRADSDFLKKEINLQNPISRELLGQGIGARVELEKNPIQPRFSTITALTNKYVHVYRDALSTHSRRFPERRDFVAFTTPTNEKGEVDVEALRKQMLMALPDDSHQRIAEDFYKQGKFTIGNVARLAGREVSTTTIYLATRPDLGIRSSTGAQEEYEHGLRAMSSMKGIVIDPTSIAIMELLKIKELVKNKYGSLFLAQSTIDEFDMMLALRSVKDTQPGRSMHKDKGQLYIEETSVEDRKKHNEALKLLIEWLRANAVVKPVNLTLAMKKDAKKEMDDVFGAPMFDSLLLAKENGLLLYTDDGKFRDIAEKEHGVSGIWTHCVLRDSLAKGFILDSEYDDYTIALLTFNVQHVSITSSTLVAAASKASWRPDHPFPSTLYNLTGLRCGENPAIIVAGEFLYTLWTQGLAPLTRDVMIFAVLDAITTNRRRDTAIKKMELFIARKFLLWPQAASALQGLVDSWKRSRML